MGWTRARCDDYESLNIPQVCPNCLGTPATVPVTVVRDLADIKYSITLPFCTGCAGLVKRRKRIALLAGVLPAVAVAIGGCAVGLNTTSADASNAWMMGGLLVALVVLVAGFALAGLIMHFAPKTGGRVSNFEAVRISRGGKKFMSKAHFFDLEFLNGEYARMLAEANPDLDIRIDWPDR